MGTVGLVLGAGGVLGGAYHAGALVALHDVTGFDARDATLIVGTSAGSIAAGGLRAGIGPADHLAQALDRPLSPEGQAIIARAGDARGDRALVRFPAGARWAAPANLLLAARGLLPVGRVPPGVALAGALPAGQAGTELISEPLDRVHPAPWPAQPTWIVAVRLRDGARAVFGRDDLPAATIGRAAAASSAIPGFFRPVEIDGERFVDGGTHSTTNADLCAGLALDLVVVVAPMSATRAVLRRPVAGPRLLHARALAREVARVRAAGTPVLTIQPTTTDRALLASSAMDLRFRAEVAETARRSVADRLRSPAAADRIALLRATGRRGPTGS